jgi:hypothetical protein
MIPYRYCQGWCLVLTVILPALAIIGGNPRPATAEELVYVGSESCQACHEAQYDSYTAYSRKAHSYASVEVMRKGLTDAEYRGCLQCHATGYGQPGGFTSTAETPHLQNLGCESCHGPGSDHVETGDPDDIISELSAADCERCHNAERVDNFKFKPLLFGGAH